VSVILDISIQKTLDYGVPDQLAHKIKRGLRVEVPIRGRFEKGYIFDIKEKSDFPKVLPIRNIISDHEYLADDLFELGIFMSKYYCASLSHVFKTMMPAIVRKDTKHKEQLFIIRAKTKEELRSYCEEIRNKNSPQADVLEVMLQVTKGILLSELLEKTGGSRSPVDTLAKKGYLILDIVRVDRSPLLNEEYFKVKPKTLSDDQHEALQKITASIVNNTYETHLLYGVTGSGKTEVYLQAIAKALELGKGTIMLVPEISLTAQTIERFRSRFEGHIAILHHALSQGERFDEWHKIREGKANIVIGARSAIFSPVRNLGLIIVDEEHENSYKQHDESPCYHARDIAVMRGKITSSTVILGSATPSLESFTNAKNNKYTLSTLTARADKATMPVIHIVNMTTECERQKCYTSFSSLLLDGIKKRMSVGEQTILFLNRRGYHTTLFCESCQLPVKCNHCDVALTFHKQEHLLSCHLCGFQLSPPPTNCPTCKIANPMKYKGVGTEQIEKALQAIFPSIRTLRVDRDTTKHKGSLQKLLRDFGSGKADVMIGTQMIAKGLHFPLVTLVGVLNSDSGLNIPDFRSSENTFQLITQVSGRSGRGAIAGEVIIQTRMPDNMAIQLSTKQDYEKFYEEEIAIRQIFNYPPFSSMAKIAFSGSLEDNTLQVAERLRSYLITALPPHFEINPVIKSGHAKVKDKFRFQFLIRGGHVFPIAKAFEEIKLKRLVPANVKLHVDINPTSTFF
jgi:primosomal protein N' (replication factor Y)